MDGGIPYLWFIRNPQIFILIDVKIPKHSVSIQILFDHNINRKRNVCLFDIEYRILLKIPNNQHSLYERFNNVFNFILNIHVFQWALTDAINLHIISLCHIIYSEWN